jgi:hypothetical protein
MASERERKSFFAMGLARKKNINKGILKDEDKGHKLSKLQLLACFLFG